MPDNTPAKSPLQSRTIRFNAIMTTLLAGLVAFQEMEGALDLPSWVWPALCIMITMINTALRFVTTEPITRQK